MITASFLALLGLAVTVSLTDWRRGWILAVICGVVQDPVRKLTPGMPVALSLSVVVVYMTILVAISERIQRGAREFGRRFPALTSRFGILFFFLLLAAANGLITFGVSSWKAPLLSLFIYLAPIPAVLLGFLYLEREDMLYAFFRFYTLLTSAVLIGSLFEYLRFDWRALGMVLQEGDYIRHLPGIQIRMISGFYRAPDIMAWHAATMTSIAIGMIVRRGIGRNAWPWMAAAGWGFFNCMISGRRKAIYYVAVFALALLWRYMSRLKPAQVAAVAAAGLVLAGVIHRMSSNEKTSVYAKGALTTQEEVTERLSGGVLDTFEQFGIMGAGLGTATQGAHYLVADAQAGKLGWQEGGLGKLAVELGLPGLIAVALLAWVLVRVLLRITKVPDFPESSQLSRVILFALLVANVANFMASAQAYSDPVIVLITAFFAGCLFATTTLDERAGAAAVVPRSLAPATV